MICGNDFTRQFRAQLEFEAHIVTSGIRVIVLHPRYIRSCPTYRNGTVRLPASLMTFSDLWPSTWRHELQHAADDRSGLLQYLSVEEAEYRARKAETAARWEIEMTNKIANQPQPQPKRR